MKKLLLSALVLVAAAFASNAQTVEKDSAEDVKITASINELKYAKLVNTQNELLKQRNTALIMTAASAGASVLFITMGSVASSNSSSRIGAACNVIGVTGILTFAGSGVWLLVNNFQLIKNQRLINGMKLEAIPGGMALKF